MAASLPQLPHERLSERLHVSFSRDPRSAIRETTDAKFGSSVVSLPLPIS
jgi:hypothetical protein